MMTIALEILTRQKTLPDAHLRVELGRLPRPGRLPTPYVITLFAREKPTDAWRPTVNYCYHNPMTALDDARQMVDGYRAAGEAVEDNLDQVEMVCITPVSREVEEVLRGRGK